jgi:hypothetical protein
VREPVGVSQPLADSLDTGSIRALPFSAWDCLLLGGH